MADRRDSGEQISRREFLRRAGATAAALGLGAGASPWGAFAAQQASGAMPRRPLGRTGQRSSIVAFGGVMLSGVSQQEADRAVGYALDHGVNHFDVAPSYGDAQSRLGPALAGHRSQVFLACKTEKRTRKEAEAEFQQSLKLLQTDHFDLYQFHALDTPEDLDIVTGPGGAWELFRELKGKGLVRFVGITGHRPSTQLEALRRMPLDTVMCPVNFIEEGRIHAAPLLEQAAAKGIGAMAIKCASSGQWPSGKHTYATWYRPFDDPEQLALSVRYTLSQPVATAPSPGDIKLLKPVIEVAEHFTPLSLEEQRKLLATAGKYQPLFEKA
jgi:predicted aldo/keto reductase-like oxidoreductase